MADPVGAALGVLGLAGLFTVAVDCFDYVQSGRSLGKDFAILESQFQGLRVRLFAWGRVAGLTRPEGYDQRLNDPRWLHHVQLQLNTISLLFLDGAKLINKYELADRYQLQTQNETGPVNQFIEDGLQDFLRRIVQTKKQAGVLGAIKWALRDKKKFTELLQNLNPAVEQLEWVLQNLDLFEDQRRIVRSESLSISQDIELEDPGHPESKIPNTALLEANAQSSSTDPAPILFGERQLVERPARITVLDDNEEHSPFERLLGPTNQHVIQNPPTHKVCWVVPFERNIHFVGRTASLEKLEEGLFADDRFQKFAITGLGGVGKTQIALELVYRARQNHPECFIFWVPATSMESFQQAYMEIGRQLNVPGLQDQQADVIKLVRDCLSRETANQWLLIVDNADDVGIWTDTAAKTTGWSGLIDCLPRHSQGSIVFTARSRKTAVKLANRNVVEVTQMPEDAATQLLLNSLIGKEDVEDFSVTMQLLEKLAYLPLAITQAAAYINENGSTFEEYLALLNEKEEGVVELLSENFEDELRYKEIQNSIATTWLISFEQIRRSDPLAAEYLSFMSCVQPKNIPLSLLPPAKSTKQASDAIGTLNAYAFVTKRPADQSLDLHRLVHLATRNWLRMEDSLTEWSKKAFVRVCEVFPDHNYGNRLAWRRYLPQAQYVLDSQVLDDISVEERLLLLERMGLCLLSDGRYDAAEKLTTQLMETREKMLSTEDPATLRVMQNLATVFWKQGRHTEAEELQVKVVETRKKLLGDEHTTTLICMNDLAVSFLEQGRFKEAEELQAKVLATRKRVFGDEHRETLVSTNNLAVTYRMQKRWKKAEELQTQVVHIRKKVLGSEHPDTLTSMNNLAVALIAQGRWKEAEEMQVHVLGIEKEVFGVDHPETTVSMHNLAGIWKRQGRNADAVKLMEECIQLRNRTLKADHPHTLSYLAELRDWKAEQL